MPGFCVSCGAPLTGAFCNKCGAKAVPPGAPAQTFAQPAGSVPAQPGFTPVQAPTPIQPMTATAAKSSGAGKILLWVGGILLALFLIGAAAAMYGVYWVKHKVSSYASAVGMTSGSSETIKVVGHGNSCRLLSTSELQQVLGVQIEKSAEIEEETHPGCAYYTNQAAFDQLRRMALEQAKRQADEVNSRPGPKPDNLPALMKNANELEGVIKDLGMSQPSQDGRVFAFVLDQADGPQSWSAARLVQATVPGFEEIPGVGDHAMIGAFGHAFYVLKGNTMITMETMMVPDTRARGSALAQKIIEKL